MDAQEMRGRAVVSIAEAARLGRVDDVLFRSDPLQAAALRVTTDHGARIVGIHTIRTFGEDALTTDTEANAADGEPDLRHQGLRGLDELANLKVVDRDGRYLGHVARVDFDPATGDVRSVDVRKGDLLGWGGESATIGRDSVVAVGDELITVNRGSGA